MREQKEHKITAVQRVLEELRARARIKAGEYCLTDADIAQFQGEAQDWFDQIILGSPSLAGITRADCWPEVKEKFQSILDGIGAQKDICFPSWDEAVYEVRRYYGLGVQDIKVWALENCKQEEEASRPVQTTGICGQCTVEGFEEFEDGVYATVDCTSPWHLGKWIPLSEFDVTPRAGYIYNEVCDACPARNVSGINCRYELANGSKGE